MQEWGEDDCHKERKQPMKPQNIFEDNVQLLRVLYQTKESPPPKALNGNSR